jgi:hypothetical protein
MADGQRADCRVGVAASSIPRSKAPLIRNVKRRLVSTSIQKRARMVAAGWLHSLQSPHTGV